MIARYLRLDQRMKKHVPFWQTGTLSSTGTNKTRKEYFEKSKHRISLLRFWESRKTQNQISWWGQFSCFSRDARYLYYTSYNHIVSYYHCCCSWVLIGIYQAFGGSKLGPKAYYYYFLSFDSYIGSTCGSCLYPIG